MGWFLIELTTTNLVLNALVDDKFCLLFFSCFLIIHNLLKKQRKIFLELQPVKLELTTLRLWDLRAAVCRLRHGCMRCLFVLRHFCVSVTIFSLITQKLCFFSKTKNTQMNCFNVNISCIWHPLFARLRYNLIFFVDWFY